MLSLDFIESGFKLVCELYISIILNSIYFSKMSIGNEYFLKFF